MKAQESVITGLSRKVSDRRESSVGVGELNPPKAKKKEESRLRLAIRNEMIKKRPIDLRFSFPSLTY